MLSLIPKNLERTARWFHALADETRLQIVDRLRDGEQCVCDLTGMLGTAQSLLSFHLKTLKEAGILRDRPEDTMASDQDIKDVVKKKYGQAALRVTSGDSSCCSPRPVAGECDPITS